MSAKKEQYKLVYLLPQEAPEWKHALYNRNLRLSRLIELNAPDRLILNEVNLLIMLLFNQIPTDISDEE